jgi:hypothetical protein
MLALLAFIGATIATYVKFPPVADALGTTLSSTITETKGYRDLPAAEQREFGEGLDRVPKVLEILVLVTSIVAIAWPVISLLVLFFSRGIKEACAPAPYPRP